MPVKNGYDPLKPSKFYCPKCDSTHVRMRNWTVWDADRQQWVDDDDDPHAQTYCFDCGWEGDFSDLVEGNV